jgi:hypothetical protein
VVAIDVQIHAEQIPAEVEEVFQRFLTCEFSTIGRDGTPITWPLSALWQPDMGRFLLTTSIGLSQKVANIRSNARVSLLFSDPMGSRLSEPLTVLVQGEASAPEEVRIVEGLEDFWRMIFTRQQLPALLSIVNPLIRPGMDWYYMRIPISVVPKRITWWRKGQIEGTRDWRRSESEGVQVGAVSIPHIGDTGGEVLNMNEIAKHLGEFGSAVLSWVDSTGYPFSLRCHPVVDEAKQVLSLDLPSYAPATSGPAGLLCHRHDERLFGLRSFLVRGSLEQRVDRWCFRPIRFVPGAGVSGIIGDLRFTRKAQAQAKRYLAVRGLPRPAIPWQVLLRLKAEASSVKRNDG